MLPIKYARVDGVDLDDRRERTRCVRTPATHGDFALGAGEVHIWTVDLKSHVRDACTSILSADELEMAERYRFAKDRDAFLARRVARRRIVSGYVGQAPSELTFESNEWGKPRLSSLQACSGIEFNASRSRDLAVIAVSNKITVGVDVEFNDPRIDFLSVADCFFTKAELHVLHRLGKAPQHAAFYRLWTQKEALGKAIGHGLSGEPKQNASDHQSAHHESGDCISAMDLTAGNWRFQPLELDAPGYVAILCSNAEKCQLQYFTYG